MDGGIKFQTFFLYEKKILPSFGTISKLIDPIISNLRNPLITLSSNFGFSKCFVEDFSDKTCIFIVHNKNRNNKYLTFNYEVTDDFS